MCNNCRNYNKLTRPHFSSNVWDPSRDVLRQDVKLVPLEEWHEDGDEYPRAGGDSWVPSVRLVKLTNGELEAVAIQMHEWHGGYHSGNSYYDYQPVCNNR